MSANRVNFGKFRHRIFENFSRFSLRGAYVPIAPDWNVRKYRIRAKPALVCHLCDSFAMAHFLRVLGRIKCATKRIMKKCVRQTGTVRTRIKNEYIGVHSTTTAVLLKRYVSRKILS